jgi:hypothetical protein
MNERINRLRTRSLEAVPSLSDERARLLTGFYKSGVARTAPIPVQRAMAFAAIMENKKIFIGPDELIVGERGPLPKATPTYPEVCVHSRQDLDIIDGREKVAFTVDDAVRDSYREDDHPFLAGATRFASSFFLICRTIGNRLMRRGFLPSSRNSDPRDTRPAGTKFTAKDAGLEGRRSATRWIGWIFLTTGKRWTKKTS